MTQISHCSGRHKTGSENSGLFVSLEAGRFAREGLCLEHLQGDVRREYLRENCREY